MDCQQRNSRFGSPFRGIAYSERTDSKTRPDGHTSRLLRGSDLLYARDKARVQALASLGCNNPGKIDDPA